MWLVVTDFNQRAGLLYQARLRPVQRRPGVADEIALAIMRVVDAVQRSEEAAADEQAIREI